MNSINSQNFPSKQESIENFLPPRIIVDNGGRGEHHRKKRSKVSRMGDMAENLKPKGGKKPDPMAAKITRPCSECGRRFWSWKALFGHMRCHPERQWRGINPPPNLHRSTEAGGPSSSTLNFNELTSVDHEVAACLMMLANGPSSSEALQLSPNHCRNESSVSIEQDVGMINVDIAHLDYSNCRFECSSCKRVFGSHQALGGHRATHKNVKGCFANRRNEVEETEAEEYDSSNNEGKVMGHKCSICLKVFSSGQALGGHKRCHFEKGEEHGLDSFSITKDFDLDLNLPAPPENENPSSDFVLDLRLGI